MQCDLSWCGVKMFNGYTTVTIIDHEATSSSTLYEHIAWLEEHNIEMEDWSFTFTAGNGIQMRFVFENKKDAVFFKMVRG